MRVSVSYSQEPFEFPNMTQPRPNQSKMLVMYLNVDSPPHLHLRTPLLQLPPRMACLPLLVHLVLQCSYYMYYLSTGAFAHRIACTPCFNLSKAMKHQGALARKATITLSVP